MIARPVLLDVTRLVSRSWTRRYSTGIDRVCYAYLDQFGPRAQAVVQHRGVLRVLTPRHSDTLFAMLTGPDSQFRSRMMTFAPRAIATAAPRVDGRQAIYLNVSHTDFDLSDHIGWTRASDLRPVYLLHDLIPITHPHFCRPHAVRRHRGRVLNALATGAGIIVNSAATAEDLASFAASQGVRLPSVLTAPLAGAPLQHQAATAAAADPYFVCVGTIEPRKNHLALLQLWDRLVARLGDLAPRLVVIGQWGSGSDPVRATLRTNGRLRDHVTIIDRCADGDMARLVSGAEALLMPTLAEGFGLPLVEALELGTPVIASDLPCFRELGQGIPTLLDPHDLDAWEGAIRSFSGDGGDRYRQLGLMAGFRPYRWSDHFAGVEAWLETLSSWSGTTRSGPVPALDLHDHDVPRSETSGWMGRPPDTGFVAGLHPTPIDR
ncbi:glycosyltransferase family 1 protein [Sphingomonas sp. HF-S3]|uniref:Glycosyltransferase family 1 protein n=1 Tax=Sphingomonas rustica TaxID=3103142 RepID=A0ABV0BGR7_9SPHN